MSYTPGPWIVGSSPSHWYSDSRFDGTVRAGNNGDFICESTSYEDARLIAAAPDLLSLVERMAYMLDGGDSPSLDERDRWIADADAAIAKARGEAVQS